MDGRTYIRQYFDTYEQAQELNVKLTKIDKQERPELYVFEGSTWCEPQPEDDKWWVLTWLIDN